MAMKGSPSCGLIQEQFLQNLLMSGLVFWVLVIYRISLELILLLLVLGALVFFFFLNFEKKKKINLVYYCLHD